MSSQGLLKSFLLWLLIFGITPLSPAEASDTPCYESGISGVITGIGSCIGEVVVGPEISVIGEGAFDPFTNWDYRSPQKYITSIDLSLSNVESISAHAFSNNMQLETVTLPSTLNEIGDSAFAGDQNLHNITFPSNLAKIGSNAFVNVLLSEIVIPDSVTVIGQDAFNSNPSLISLTIGTGLTSLGANAFSPYFQGTVVVSETNTHFVAINGMLYTIDGVQLTGKSQPSDNSIPNNGGGESSGGVISGVNGISGSNGNTGQDQGAQPGLNSGDSAQPQVGCERCSEQPRPGSGPGQQNHGAGDSADSQVSAALVKAKDELKNVLQGAGKPSLDTYLSAGIDGIRENNIERVSQLLLTLPIDQRTSLEAIEKMVTVVTFFDPHIPPTIDDFKNKGMTTVTEKIVGKLAIELLSLPESAQGDLTVIKQIVRRVETVDKLSTPGTAKDVQASDLIAINAISSSNPKKFTITSALKKLDPSSIDTYQKVLVEIAKQEVVIKVRAEKLAAKRAKLAASLAKL